MKIDKLVIDNYRGMKHVELDFGGNTVVLFGTNGAGKSSILNAIMLVLSKLLYDAAYFDQRIEVISDRTARACPGLHR